MDNHYAIDYPEMNGDHVINYITTSSLQTFIYCEEGANGNTFPHYITDPTGWGIQIGLNISAEASRLVKQNFLSETLTPISLLLHHSFSAINSYELLTTSKNHRFQLPPGLSDKDV